MREALSDQLTSDFTDGDYAVTTTVSPVLRLELQQRQFGVRDVTRNVTLMLLPAQVQPLWGENQGCPTGQSTGGWSSKPLQFDPLHLSLRVIVVPHKDLLPSHWLVAAL